MGHRQRIYSPLRLRNGLIRHMADSEGFEPSKVCYNLAGLANRCIKPLCQLSSLADSVGFEPTDPFGSVVFKTTAINQTLPTVRFEYLCTDIERLTNFRYTY